MSNEAHGVHPSKASLAVAEALHNYDEVAFDSQDIVLYDYVDPDALNQLFRHAHSAADRVEFAIQDKTITVWQDGAIHAQIQSEQHTEP